MSGPIIAATFGMSSADAREYRYQPGRTKCALYAIGDNYYATSKSMPPDDYAWEPSDDQFFAARKGTVLWVARMASSK